MNYGKRGGDAPNRGKSRTEWRTVAPDGTVLIKTTFKMPSKPAIWAYRHQGKWYASCVSEIDDPVMADSRQIAFPAELT